MPRDDFEDKSHYNYDEMMARLKDSRSSGRGSGDGKKRRRRTEQAPTGKSKKFKVIAAIAAILVIIALAIPVALFMMSRGQYTTDAFRRSLNDRVSAFTGKSVDFGPFRMQGSSLFSQKLELNDESRAGWVHQARLTGLRADFDTTIHQGTEWPIKKLAVTSAQVVLGTQSGKPLQVPSPSGVQLSQPIGGLDPSPTAIIVSDLYVRELDLAWGPKGFYDTLRGGKLQAQIVGESVTWQLTDATLQFGHIPALTVAGISGELANGKVTISRGIIGYSKNEHGAIKGEIMLSSPAGARLNFSLENMKLNNWLDLHHRKDGQASAGLLADTLIPAPWEKRFRDGSISIHGEYITSYEPDAAAPVMQGTFVLNDLLVRDWHLFYTMGLAFDESALNSLKFSKLTGKFHKQNGILTISELEGEHKGLLQIRGSFTITSNPERLREIPTIAGALKIGLPAVDLSGFPDGYPDFFTQPADGFGWTTVNLTGPLDEPVHDFVERLPAEMQKNLPRAPWQ
ncbi:MAG: hypothetical protein ACI9R3_000367 [Verrucomicrobiales bacterium]|jgi:hypothetical protein